MPDRDGYPAGVPCWVDTSQPDPEAAAEFYGALFGWETENVMPADSGGKYFMARIRGRDVAAISSQQEGGGPPSWNTYVWVDSADDTAAKVRGAGGNVLSEPFDVFDSGRMAVCADPQGAVFCVWQAANHKGSRVVNEHGSVNFNNLVTNDVEGAKAFYGAVFGWKALDMGNFAAWTLPGYGDHLEELNPGTRENMGEMGAPGGFIDVVASLGETSGDEPSHWGLTFGTDEADATAKRAAELGGEVLVPPMDAPWVRMAIIRDPQGAVFTASQFVPENSELPTDGAATAA